MGSGLVAFASLEDLEAHLKERPERRGGGSLSGKRLYAKGPSGPLFSWTFSRRGAFHDRAFLETGATPLSIFFLNAPGTRREDQASKIEGLEGPFRRKKRG